MRIINGNYIPSVTEIMRAAAHCRALAAEEHYSGRVAAYWDLDDGSVSYHDFVGCGWWLQSNRRVEIASADTGRGRPYAGSRAACTWCATLARNGVLSAIDVTA